MKNILLASTAALLVTAGYAAAEVTVTGDARMGIIEGFDFVDDDPVDEDGDGIFDAFDDLDTDDIGFTSRIGIRFAASGETDGGLSFGGSVRVDHYEDDQATLGEEGSVFASGAFGKITMGDVSGAAESAVGDVSGVGLTGLGDYNEFIYLSNSGRDARPSATYEYTTGDLTFYVSADNPQQDDDDEMYSVAAKYTFMTYTVGLGYEMGESDTDFIINDSDTTDANQWIIGGTAGFGDFTVKAIYASADLDDDDDFKQYGVSLDYVMGATTLTGFYRRIDVDDEDAFNTTAYGVGASYDLGGGASLKGGIVKVDSPLSGTFVDDDTTGEEVFIPTSGDDDIAFDFGLSMTF